MSTEAMKLALEALENLLNEASSHNNNSYCQLDVIDTEEADNAIKALEEALAKQEQGEHKESVRLQCVVCNTVYEDGVPPQVAKQEQGEPVAWACWLDSQNPETDKPIVVQYEPLAYSKRRPLTYTTPQQRKPLTDEQIKHMLELFVVPPQHVEMVVRAIEAAHGIKETP